MKICFIDWFAYPLFNPKSNIVFGGAQIQLYLLAKELAKNKNFKIFFLTDNQKNNQQEVFDQIKVFQMFRSPQAFGYLGFFVQFLAQLRQINADIFIQRAASAETGLIALICWLLRKKFIFMVAHIQDVNGDFMKKNGWRGKLFGFGLILADRIVCQTRDQQRQLSKNLRGKSVIVPLAYPIKPRLRQKNINKQGILWVARAETWKNPELLLALAAKFPREKFTMICPPAENNPDYFKIIKAKAKQISNLQFIAWVPFNKIDAFFRKSRVFVSTSFSEGFPNTFIQAAKNMTPIVSYQVDPDKIISQNKLGFCAKGDEKMLTEYLKKVLRNQKFWRRLSDRAYQYAVGHHDLSEVVDKFKSIVLNW